MSMLTVTDVAKRLKLSESTVRRMMNVGELPFVRVGRGRGRLRVMEEDMQLYLDVNREEKQPTRQASPRRPLEHLTVSESTG